MDERRIRAALRDAGLEYLHDLNAELVEQLSIWLQRLASAPRNLTAIRDPDAALQKHAIEPLLGRHRLIAADLPVPHGPMIDIGSGNGAPGLPIALCEPHRPALLIDSRAGAAEFLEGTLAAIAAKQVSVRCARAEEAARGPTREQFALAVSRAAAPPPAALELALPFLHIGGVAALWTGRLSEEELAQCNAVMSALGAVPTPIDAPELLVATKQRPTDPRFPRRWSQIRRGPPTAA